MSPFQFPRILVVALGVGLLPPSAAAHVAGTDGCAWLDAAAAPGRGAGSAFSWSVLPASSALPIQPRHRIALWGDSLTAAPDFVDAALAVYGVQKNTIAPSFIQAGLKAPALRLPLKAACASAGWKLTYAYKEKTATPGFSRGLMSMSSDQPGDTMALDFRFPAPSTRVSALDLVYEKSRADGSLLLGVTIDGGAEQLLSLTRHPGTTLHIAPDAPTATIRIRLVSGQMTVHGFEPVYRDAPAVVVDNFSIPGALLRGWSNVGERFLADVGSAASYSLILLQYGTNEGAAPHFERDKYQSYLRTHLQQVRRFYPHARCILIGPPDRGVTGAAGAAALANSAVHRQIALAQKAVGAEFRCGFWDWQAAMGGPGAAARWAAMNPPQMQPDLTHLTAKGYAASGRMFATTFPLD